MTYRATPPLPCLLGLLTSATLLTGQGLDPTRDKIIKPTVIVNVGKPNAWTMEQAHYLLERNRAHDLGIAAQDLGPLDANEIVGYRLDAVRSLLSVQAQYDQSTGKKNSATQAQYQKDMGRYAELTAQQDQLTRQQATIAGQLAIAQYRLALLQAQTPPDQQQIQQQTAEVGRITGIKGAIDAQLAAVTKAIPTEPSLTGLTSTMPNADATAATIIGTNPTFTSMMQGLPQGLNNSKLQASIKLDNYINLQYEIVAKQLTLLRDQAGTGNRIIFLELPQSIYVTQKFKLYPDLGAFWGSHLAQTWWRIDGVFLASRKHGTPAEAVTFQASDQPTGPPTTTEFQRALQSFSDTLGSSLDAVRAFFKGTPNAATPSQSETVDKTNNIKEKVSQFSYSYVVRPDLSTATNQTAKGATSPSNWSALHPAYALDLIPRRSALNVAEAHSSSHAYGFAGLFGFLTGFGAKVRYERQRDEYNQYAQQEAYASSFGKGEDIFGWTFGPLPGTKRMDPGMRTTYAVLVVPNDTRFVRLTAVGCGYRRRMVPKNPFTLNTGDEDCGAPATYDVEIPHRDDDFYITKATYKPTSTGRRITVALEGTFGTQIGVLINGTPLQRVVAIGQPMLEQTAFTLPSNAGETNISGVFELVGTGQILMTFSMPPTFAGTPEITIVTPTRAASINDYRIDIRDGRPGIFVDFGASSASNPALPDNETIGPSDRNQNTANDQTDFASAQSQPARVQKTRPGRTLSEHGVAPMFFQNPSITRVAPNYLAATTNNDPASVLASLFGQGYSHASGHTLLLNGDALTEQEDRDAPLKIGEYRMLNAGVLQARFDRTKYYPHWQFDYITHDPEQTLDAASAYDDDGVPSYTDCTVKTTTEKGVVTALDITLNGHFFNLGYTPTGRDKHITLISVQLASADAWTIHAMVPKGEEWTAAGLLFKGPRSNYLPTIYLKTCKMPAGEAATSDNTAGSAQRK